MIQLKLNRAPGWRRLWLAVSVSGLLLTPTAHADPATPPAVATPPAAWNPYATPGAVPPPPGPFETAPAAGGPRFRPDTDLDGAAGGLPPGMPPEFSNQTRHGSLTRQQFIDRQKAHRKQLEQHYQQREAEMKQRVEDMQKRMDEMQAQSEAEHHGPGADIAQQEQQRWEQQKAEQAKRWEQQKAQQEQRMQQMRAEHDKQLEQMKAEQAQRIQTRSRYRPLTEPASPPGTAQAPAVAQAKPKPKTNPKTNPAPQVTAPTRVPAYGYGYPPRGYGYGYPPPPYGYAAPGWGYPRFPAPAAGGRPVR